MVALCPQQHFLPSENVPRSPRPTAEHIGGKSLSITHTYSALYGSLQTSKYASSRTEGRKEGDDKKQFLAINSIVPIATKFTPAILAKRQRHGLRTGGPKKKSGRGEGRGRGRGEPPLRSCSSCRSSAPCRGRERPARASIRRRCRDRGSRGEFDRSAAQYQHGL